MNSGDSILEALDLETQYRVSFWDALVIQAAHAAGAEILYSEDLSTVNGRRMVIACAASATSRGGAHLPKTKAPSGTTTVLFE